MVKSSSVGKIKKLKLNYCVAFVRLSYLACIYYLCITLLIHYTQHYFMLMLFYVNLLLSVDYVIWRH